MNLFLKNSVKIQRAFVTTKLNKVLHVQFANWTNFWCAGQFEFHFYLVIMVLFIDRLRKHMRSFSEFCEKNFYVTLFWPHENSSPFFDTRLSKDFSTKISVCLEFNFLDTPQTTKLERKCDFLSVQVKTKVQFSKK